MTHDTDKHTELEGALKEVFLETDPAEIPSDWRKSLMADVRKDAQKTPEVLDAWRFLKPYAAAASFAAIATGAYAIITRLHQLEWMCLDFVWDLELIYFWL